MKMLRCLWLMLACGLLGACGSTDLCEDTEFYQTAEDGDRIAVPDDLDEPPVDQEMAIPDVAERPDGYQVTGCLEAPPPIST